MSAEIRYDGQEYWVVARRYHMNRGNPMMKPSAVRDMNRALLATPSRAVRARCLAFVHRHQPPGNSPNGGGPKRA